MEFRTATNENTNDALETDSKLGMALSIVWRSLEPNQQKEVFQLIKGYMDCNLKDEVHQ